MNYLPVLKCFPLIFTEITQTYFFFFNHKMTLEFDNTSVLRIYEYKRMYDVIKNQDFKKRELFFLQDRKIKFIISF